MTVSSRFTPLEYDMYMHYNKHDIATDELIVRYMPDGIEVDFGDGEKLILDIPNIAIKMNNTQYIHIRPHQMISFEGEIIGRSFHDLSLGRVAIVDWTVYSDDWDHEQWTILSWVIVAKGSLDEQRLAEDGIDIMERTLRILEENVNAENI